MPAMLLGVELWMGCTCAKASVSGSSNQSPVCLLGSVWHGLAWPGPYRQHKEQSRAQTLVVQSTFGISRRISHVLRQQGMLACYKAYRLTAFAAPGSPQALQSEMGRSKDKLASDGRTDATDDG